MPRKQQQVVNLKLETSPKSGAFGNYICVEAGKCGLAVGRDREDIMACK